MDKVLPLDETLKSQQTVNMLAKVNIEEPKSLLLYLDEYRIELKDNNMDFMDLTEAKNLKYLNIREQPIELSQPGSTFRIALALSSNITI